jgi:hypothetical protein
MKNKYNVWDVVLYECFEQHVGVILETCKTRHHKYEYLVLICGCSDFMGKQWWLREEEIKQVLYQHNQSEEE